MQTAGPTDPLGAAPQAGEPHVAVPVHEAPRISAPVNDPLKLGAVVTVEPGLYYPGLGGCRIEDVAWLTAEGHKLLSSHPYKWELA